MDYGRVADLPVTIEGITLRQRSEGTASGFSRTTTTIACHGEGAVGLGEDVTYDDTDHRALEASTFGPLEGTHTVASVAERVAEMELFPAGPQRPPSRRYRQWAVESAVLDLALRQADLAMTEVFDATTDPVRFVVATTLGESPSFDRIARLREQYPGVELKLDPTPEWRAELFDRLAATDAVSVLDLRGQYAHADVHQPASVPLYERVFENFPEAIIEDPATSEDVRPLLADHADRLAWDVPVTSVAALEDLPFEPGWVNVTPSRIGSLEELCRLITYCREHDIGMYGGGQFELGVGRSQIQTLASLYYPDAPNDVAPSAFDDPDAGTALPTSPLEPPATTPGFGTH